MRIGLVQYINSRPLDYGIRKDPAHTTVEDTPAALYELLKNGKLDAALISSVECLRNAELFDYCKTTGICAESDVGSIFYLTTDPDKAPDLFLSDRGSRSSVALLQILLYKKFGKIIEHRITDPEKIPENITANTGGLIIGDLAYRYQKEIQNSRIISVDLGRWWFEEEHLPFVFALWAYPRTKPIACDFFEKSLEEGLKHIPDIVKAYGDPRVEDYLTRSLHYKLGSRELESLNRFKSLLQEVHLL